MVKKIVLKNCDCGAGAGRLCCAAGVAPWRSWRREPGLAMKRMSPSESSRFKGGIRHCHRAGSRQASWEEWIDGQSHSTRLKKHWLKIIIVAAAILALGGIIVGLVVELGVN
jgi:hypothetical protein